MMRFCNLTTFLLLVLYGCQGRSNKDCSPTPEQEKAAALASSNLAGCLAENAAPTRFCEYCMSDKIAWDEAYNNLSDTCQKFGVFKQLQDSLIGMDDTDEGLWTNSHCSACSSDIVKDFNVLMCDFARCANHSATCNDDYFTANKTVCTRCLKEYEAVVKFHDEEMSKKCKANADVIDRYRRHLVFWASHDCSVIDVSRNLVIVVVIVAGAVPLSFYQCVYLYQTKFRQHSLPSSHPAESEPLLHTTASSMDVFPAGTVARRRRLVRSSSTGSIGSTTSLPPEKLQYADWKPPDVDVHPASEAPSPQVGKRSAKAKPSVRFSLQPTSESEPRDFRDHGNGSAMVEMLDEADEDDMSGDDDSETIDSLSKSIN